MNVFRVHRDRDAIFKFAVERHKLTPQLHPVSKGAVNHYGPYVNPDVYVYVITTTATSVAALTSDLQLNPPTKDTFTIVGNNEIYI
ncbi:hypothetical protein BZK40_23215 [Citrobacter portucalensis]|nr:hypothetical protein BZK40_23215 [Citrobacter portucalensis]